MVQWAALIESVFLPLGISLAAACVFVLVWLARDRPGVFVGKSKPVFAGARHPLTWVQKTSVAVGFQVAFMVIFYLFCVDFDRRAMHTVIAVLVYSVMFVIVVAGIAATIASFIFKNDLLLAFIVFGLCSGFVAFGLGTMIFDTYVSTERQATEGKHFVGVSPFSHASGFRDAGTLEFTPKAVVDESRAVGYKSQSSYCVAPIVTSTVSDAPIQFWAVGVDCCNSRASFSCGAYDAVPLYGTVIAPPVNPPTTNWSWDTEYEQYHRAVRMASSDFVTNTQPILVKLREAPNAAVTLFNMSCGGKNLGMHVDKSKTEKFKMGDAEWKQFLPVRGEGDWYFILAQHVDAYWFLSTDDVDQELFLSSREHAIGPLAGYQRWTIAVDGTIHSLKATSKGSYLSCMGTMSNVPSADKWTFKGWNFGEEASSTWGSGLNAVIFFGSGTAMMWFFIFSALYFVAVLSILAIIPMPLGKGRDPDRLTAPANRLPSSRD